MSRLTEAADRLGEWADEVDTYVAQYNYDERAGSQTLWRATAALLRAVDIAPADLVSMPVEVSAQAITDCILGAES